VREREERREKRGETHCASKMEDESKEHSRRYSHNIVSAKIYKCT
jgi:hypothetical protein